MKKLMLSIDVECHEGLSVKGRDRTYEYDCYDRWYRERCSGADIWARGANVK